jgi:hypothetical protein
MALRAHDLRHDGPTLRRHPKALAAKEIEHVFVFGGCDRHGGDCSSVLQVQDQAG